MANNLTLDDLPAPRAQDLQPSSGSNSVSLEDLPPPAANANSPFASMGLDPVTELLKTGYNFDTYNKLSDADKQRYEDLSQHMAKVFQEGGKQGLSSALTLGFKKDIFNNPEDVQQAISQVPQQYQDIAKTQGQEGNFTGSVVGNLPLALATGGATRLATKAAAEGLGLGATGTRILQGAGNIASAGAMGEAQGIAQSNAPTLTERAKEALPSAAIGAGTAGLFEGGAAALTPEGRQAIQNGITDVRNTFARRSLGGTSGQQAALKEMQSQVGSEMFPAGSINSPIVGYTTTKAGAAANASTAKQIQGKAIENSLANIDQSASEKLAEEQAQVPFQKTNADVPAIEPSALEDSYVETRSGGGPAYTSPNAKVVEEGQTVLPGAEGKSAEITPEDTSLGFPRNELSVEKQPVQTNIIPVEKIVNPDVEAAINQKIEQAPGPIQQKISTILNPQTIANKIKSQIGSEAAQIGITNKVMPAIEMETDGLSSIGRQPDGSYKGVTLSNLFKNRMALDQSINWENPSLQDQYLIKYRNALDNELMSTAKQVDQLSGANSFDALQNAKARYGVLKRINQAAQGAVNKQEAQAASTSATPAIVGGTAKVLGASNPASIVAGAATYGAKKFGNQFAANSLNLLKQAVDAGSPALGEFAAPLQDAAKRGTSALAAMHYALYSSDPKYRDIIDPLAEEAEKNSSAQ